MQIEEARKIFADRYYCWRLSECEREVQQGFPFLSRVPHTFVIGYLEFVDNWTQSAQLDLLRALVVRYTEESTLKGRTLTEHEEQLLQAFHGACQRDLGPKLGSYSRRSYAGEFKIDRSLLRRQLKSILTEPLGPSRVFEANEYRFRTLLNGVTIRTHLDTGGATRQFSYSHTLLMGQQEYWGDQAATIREAVSMVAVLGVFPTTEWQFMTQDEIPLAAESMKMFCEHFLKAVPSLTEGFSDD